MQAITVADVAALVAELHAEGTGLKRETLRKTLSTLGMLLDFGAVAPNPVRDEHVRLPADDSEEVSPPSADHVTAAYGAIAPAYRLAVLVLDATGMRVSELQSLRWGDVGERTGRCRVSRASTKTRQGRWVPVPEIVLERVLDVVPREDRDLAGQVLAGLRRRRLPHRARQGMQGVGHPGFQPTRPEAPPRETLWHLGGVPVAEAGRLARTPPRST